MIQLRQLSLTDSLLPFLYLHSPSIRLSSFNFFFLLVFVFEFGIGVWGAIFPTDQQSRRWVGSSSLDIRAMVFFITFICPFHIREIYDNRFWEAIRSALGEYLFVSALELGIISWFSLFLFWFPTSNFYLRKSCWPMQHNLHVPWETAFWYPYSFYRVVSFSFLLFGLLYYLSTGSCGSYVFCVVSMSIYLFQLSLVLYAWIFILYVISILCHYLQTYPGAVVHYDSYRLLYKYPAVTSMLDQN